MLHLHNFLPAGRLPALSPSGPCKLLWRSCLPSHSPTGEQAARLPATTEPLPSSHLPRDSQIPPVFQHNPTTTTLVFMAWRRRGLPACPGTWRIARPPGPGPCWEAAGKSLASKPSMAARYPREALEGAPASSTGLRTPPAGTGQAPGCCCSSCTHV